MKKFLRSPWGIAILGVIGIILLIVLQRSGTLKPIENILTSALKPVQTSFFQSANRIKNFFVYFKDIKELEQENKDLKDEIAQLTADNLSLKREIADNELIVEEFKYIKQHDYQAVTAKVIGRGADEYLQVIIINKGSSDGIQKDLPVIAKSGFLVGKIIDVNSQTAKVLLLNDNHSQISAIIDNEKNSPGIISGQFGIALKMELIPEGHKVETNQLVTTSGLEQYTPSNLIIGTISQVTKRDGELFQEATIEPLVNYQNLSIVSIILPTNE